MAHQYCTEAQFYRYCPEVVGYLNPWRKLVAWAVESGSQYVVYSTGAVSVLFADGEDLGAAEASKAAVDANGEWYYDATADALYYYNDADSPNALDMQAGEDRATYIAAMLQNASRLVDAQLKKQTPVMMNKSGTYDEVMVQVTAYKLAEIVTFGRNDNLNTRYTENLINEGDTGLLQMLNDGRMMLEVEIDVDSSRGEIRQVSVSGGLNIVRTRGRWTGRPYDKIQIKITTAGPIGTGQYTTKGHDPANDLPKNLVLVGPEIIDGNFQHLGGGVDGLFMGDSADSASLNDEWEMEVWNEDEEVTHEIHSSALVRA